MKYLISLMLFLIILGLWILWSVERFVGSRFDCPTRNQSYDIRGDIYIPARENYTWLNTSIGPISGDACPRRILI